MSNSNDLDSIVVEISRNKPIEESGSTSGTGFFVSKDKIATCYHVLDPERKGLEKVYWIKSDKWNNWVEATTDFEFCKFSNDIAILHSSRPLKEELPDFKEWQEELSDDRDNRFASKGFDPERIKGLGASVFKGSIISSIKKGPHRHLQLETKIGTIRRGYSGSPIWSFEKNAIVGMIDYYAGKVDISMEMPLAIPIEEIIPLNLRDTSMKKLGKIIGKFPSLPPHYIRREEDIKWIKQILLSCGGSKTAITGGSKRVGIQGMGGIGKSVLAAAVVLDDEIRQAFPDGIFWMPIGREYKSLDCSKQSYLCNKLSGLFMALSEDNIPFETIEQGRIALSKFLFDKKILVVLDDVWMVEDFEAFNGLGQDVNILITTRNSGIITSIGAKEYRIDVLEDKDALQLLATWANLDVSDLPKLYAFNIITKCGNLPLAISIVGAMARGMDHDYWKIILDKLQNANLNDIKHEIPDYPHHDLLRAIEVSLDALAEENIDDLNASERYLEFAVFPEDVQIPKTTLFIFWKAVGLKKDQIEYLLKLLVERSLCRREENGSFSLHDLLLDYVRMRFEGNLIQLHNRLLKSYRMSYPDKWPSLPDDGYMPQNLAYHLIEAGRENELKNISKESRGRFFIVGIGGFGGKLTQLFLERRNLSRIDKLIGLIGSNISEDIKGLWLESDKNDAKNIQRFFGPITEGFYPGFFIPHDVIRDGSALHIYVSMKYGYDVKKQGFVRDPLYLKAIFEIFDADSEIQAMLTEDFRRHVSNPILESSWNAIKPFTTLGGGDCDGIIFIVSFGGGTGGGFINPIINQIRNDVNEDYPVFVLGILTEMDDNADRVQRSNAGRRNLAATITIYDLLTNKNGANGVILVDNDILLGHFWNDYWAADKFVRQMMLPMVLGRDYRGETPPSHEIAQKFSKGLLRTPIFVPFFSSIPSSRNSEDELVKRALESGRLFNCTPEKADFAVVYCRGILDSSKIKKALSNSIGLDGKKIWVMRKVGDADDEILILLRNPYGDDSEAFKREGTLENRLCRMIDSALQYIYSNTENIFYESRGMKDNGLHLPQLSKQALERFFFGSDGAQIQKNNIETKSGFVFELREARRRLEYGEKPFFTNPLKIYEKDENEMQ